MKSIEKVGSTLDVAITEALIELGASTDEVTIEVISKGSRGILGIIGTKQAKLRVTLKEESSDQVEEVLLKDEDSKEVVVPTTHTIEPKLNEKKTEEVKQENIMTDKESKPVFKAKRFEDNKDSEDMVIVTEEEMALIVERSKNFLVKLLKEMNVQSTITTEVVNNNRLSICLEGDKMGTIIGKRGETLDAIQYLVKIVANQGRRE